MYKRVTVSFKVVRTIAFPDYFKRFSQDIKTKLQIDYVSEQTSNTSYNQYVNGSIPI